MHQEIHVDMRSPVKLQEIAKIYGWPIDPRNDYDINLSVQHTLRFWLTYSSALSRARID